MKEYLPDLSDNGRKWARLFALLAALAIAIWLCYALRGVLTLLAVSFAIAYILNPLVTAIERRGVNRAGVIAGLYVVGALVLAIGGLALFVVAEQQVRQLLERLPGYIEGAREWLAANHPDWLPAAPTSAPSAESAAVAADWLKTPAATAMLQRVMSGAMSFGELLSAFGGLIATLAMVPLFSFYFLWKYEATVTAVRDSLPAVYRPTIVHVVSIIDRKTADFFRGRLIVCAIVGLLQGVGWMLVGVPYGLPFGAAVGMLNLVPYLSTLALPPVLLATYVEHSGDWAMPVALAMGVFVLVQGVESFVLYPTLIAKSSGLHPMTTVVALLIGSSAAGLLGMLLSIPIASTLGALASEYLAPEIRRLARGEPDAARDTDALP